MAESQSITNVVEVHGQQVWTTSLIVAEQCGLSHKEVIARIRKYQSGLEQLGQLAFQTREKRGTQGAPTEYAILSEDQATYLITLFRNTPIVLSFKLALVKAFRAALNEISRLYADPPRAGLLTDKRKANRPMTDALVEFREALGKLTDERHYMCEAKLCNFIVKGVFAGIDEASLSNEDATLLAGVRRRNESLLYAGIDYAERKRRLTEYSIRMRTKRIA